jgi:hypothetical protein
LLGSGNLAVGTVTSVGATVPTGLTVSGSPITSSGTLAITYTAGYAIPTTASQTNWDTAYSDRLKWDGGATGLVASTGRTSLGGTTVGQNFFTLTNPSAVTFPRMNADNTVSALSATDFRTAIGAGTGSGTVTGVTGTAPIVSSGGTAPAISITQSTTSTNGYLSSTDWNTFNGKINLSSAITGYTVGTNTALVATDTLLASLGKIQGQINARSGTVTSVSGTGTVAGLTLTGTVTSSGSLTLGGNLSITADMIYQSFTATASQTTFTPTTAYTASKIQVFANGVMMVNGADVTVTSGTSVVFASGLASGTRVDLVYPI